MSEPWCESFDKYVHPVKDGSMMPVVPMLVGYRGGEMGFGYIGRRDAMGDKCPKCSVTNVSFMVAGGGLLACFACGTVFVRKAEREIVKAQILLDRDAAITAAKNGVTKEQIEPSPKEEIVKSMEMGKMAAIEAFGPAPFQCPICGKVCKNKFGLAGHMKSHKEGER